MSLHHAGPAWAERSGPETAENALRFARVQLRLGLPARAAGSIRRAAAAIGGEEGKRVARLAPLCLADPIAALKAIERTAGDNTEGTGGD